MNRTAFLTFASLVALGVGAFAVLMPAAFLHSKGVGPNPAADVWMREVGVMLLSIGVMVFAVRRHAASPTLRAFLVGNVILQLGLLPIEILAFRGGVITQVSGIVPNSILHGLLAFGFAYFAVTMRGQPSDGDR
jgi:hypothetical protein